MADRFRTESDLAAMVVADLQRRGWRTFEEVSIPGFDERPDIVAVRGQDFIAVEVKLRLGFGLLAQAAAWWPYFKETWACAPFTAGDDFDRARLAATRAFKADGVGLMLAVGVAVSRMVPPRRNPHPADIGLRLAIRNHDPSKARPAGSPGNPRESRLAKYDEPLRDLLAQHTLHGLTVARAVRIIGAPPQYAQRVKAGKVAGVVVERGRVRLAGEEEAA